MANDLKHAPTAPAGPAPAPGGAPAADQTDPNAPVDAAPVIETGPVHAEVMRDAVESDANLAADQAEAQAQPAAPDADTPPLPGDLGDEPLSEHNREARRNAQIRLRAGSDRARAAAAATPTAQDEDERVRRVQAEIADRSRTGPAAVRTFAAAGPPADLSGPVTPRFDPSHPGGLLPAADPSAQPPLSPTPQNEMHPLGVGPAPAFPITRPAAR
jgi:hypothetical protein